MKLNYRSRMLFTENMASLLRSGLGITESLEICVGLYSGSERKRIAENLCESVRNGNMFSAALENECAGFSSLYIRLVRAGEESGGICEVMEKLSSYMKQTKKMRDKILGAMVYPVSVLVCCAALAILCTFYVFPKLEFLFEELSFSSESIREIKASGTYFATGALGVFFAVSALIIAWLFMKRMGGTMEEVADALLFKIPGVSELLGMFCTYNFVFVMKLLTSSGMTLVQAAKFGEESCTNTCYRKAVRMMRLGMEEGRGAMESARSNRIIPEYFSIWLGIGERTGDAAGVFSSVYDYYRNETERIADGICEKAETVFIFAAGIAVMTVAFKFVIPVFSALGDFKI